MPPSSDDPPRAAATRAIHGEPAGAHQAPTVAAAFSAVFTWKPSARRARFRVETAPRPPGGSSVNRVRPSCSTARASRPSAPPARGDREAEAAARRHRPVHPVEALEHVRAVLLGDAGPSSSTTSSAPLAARRPDADACPPACGEGRSRRGRGRPGGLAAYRRGGPDLRRVEDVAARRRERRELARPGLGDGEIDRLGLDRRRRRRAGTGPELRRQLAEPLDLRAHLDDELAACRSSSSSSSSGSRCPPSEKSASLLVRGVGDELAARVVEAGKALAHPLEGARELADLVAARRR